MERDNQEPAPGKSPDGTRSQIQSLAQTSPDHAAHLYREIAHLHGNGYTIVPFVGAGISVPSGIPPITVILDFIAHLIRHLLGQAGKKSKEKTWDLLTCRLDDLTAVAPGAARKLKNDLLNEIEAMGSNPPGVRRFPNITESLLGEALGAISEWRNGFLFLSRAIVTESRLYLGHQRPGVVDRLFQHLTAHKSPSLGHQMLANLHSVLNFPALITTNFDELLEEALLRAEIPFHAYEIPIEASFPGMTLARNELPVVKIHGGRFSLRADYSLDAPATAEECKAFANYLLRAKPGNEAAIGQRTVLLVLGYSMGERRTLELIKGACCLMPNLLVRAMFHSQPKPDSEFRRWVQAPDRPNADQSSAKESSSTGRKVDWCICENPGLGLLEIYQAITRSLPSTGTFVPASWNIPVPPAIPIPSQKNAGKTQLDEFWTNYGKLEEILIKEWGREQSLLIQTTTIGSKGEQLGAQTIAAHAYRECPKDTMTGHRPTQIWLEMDEIEAKPEDLLLKVLLAAFSITGRTGVAPSLAVGNVQNLGEFLAQFKRLGGALHQDWRIWVNLQEMVGKRENKLVFLPKAIDAIKTLAEKSEQLKDGDRALVRLHFLFILDFDPTESQQGSPSPTSSEENEVQQRTLHQTKTTPEANPAQGRHQSLSQSVLLDKAATSFSVEDAVNAALQWAKGHDHRERFLYLLCCFPTARLKAQILKAFRQCFNRNQQQQKVADGLNPGPNTFSYKHMEGYLESLRQRGVIRTKEGGLIWMGYQLRTRLMEKLVDSFKSAKDRNGSKSEGPLVEVTAQLKEAVGHSYELLFSATSDPQAALIAVELHLDAAAEGYSSTKPVIQVDATERLRLIQRCNRLIKASHALIEQRTCVDLLVAKLENLQKTTKRLLKESQQVIPGENEPKSSSSENFPTTLKNLDAEIANCLERMIRLGTHTPTTDSAPSSTSVLSAFQSLVMDSDEEHSKNSTNDQTPNPGADAKSRVNQALRRMFSEDTQPADGKNENDAEKAAHDILAFVKRAPADSVEISYKAAEFTVFRCSIPGPISAKHIRRCRWLLYASIDSGIRSGRFSEKKGTSFDRWKPYREALRVHQRSVRNLLAVLEALDGSSPTDHRHEEVRLRLLLAFIYLELGRLPRSLDDSLDANSHLELAEEMLCVADSLIRESPFGVDGLSMAVLELRRSELWFYRCAIEEQLYKRVGEARSSVSYLSPSSSSEAIPDVVRLHHGFSMSIAHAYSAVQLLEQHPRNKWWWSSWLTHGSYVILYAKVACVGEVDTVDLNGLVKTFVEFYIKVFERNASSISNLSSAMQEAARSNIVILVRGFEKEGNKDEELRKISERLAALLKS